MTVPVSDVSHTYYMHVHSSHIAFHFRTIKLIHCQDLELCKFINESLMLQSIASCDSYYWDVFEARLFIKFTKMLTDFMPESSVP